MSAEARTTIDHETIKTWVEERGGTPARIKGTGDSSGGGVLRIDYPGYSGEDTLEPIEWEEFFEIFDQNNLAFLHQDKTKDGDLSRFSKFVERDSTAEKGKAAHKS